MCGHSSPPHHAKDRVPGTPAFHPGHANTACRGPRLWRNGRVGFSFLVCTISKNSLALMTPMSNLLRRRVAMKGEEYGGRALPIRCHAGFSGQPDVIVKRFRNYCGLIKIARSGFPWEKPRKGPWLSRISCSAALRAVSQLLWSHKGREEWFSVAENHERRHGFGLYQLRNRSSEGNDVRLSLRKAACSSMAPPSSTGNPASVYTNCETAVEVVTCIDTIRGGFGL